MLTPRRSRPLRCRAAAAFLLFLLLSGCQFPSPPLLNSERIEARFGSYGIDASDIPGGVTLDAQGYSRILEITPGHTVALHGLTLTGGVASGAIPASSGGAIYNDESSLSLTACTLSGNSATDGGGIYSSGFGGSASLSLSACTLSGNAADSGGGIYSDGLDGSASLSLHNTLLAGNTAPTGPDLRERGSTSEAVTTATGQNLMSSIAGSNIGTAPAEITLVADPRLAPLGHYGGPTQTMPPLLGSPAIDTAGTTDPGGTDQRGFPRFVDGDNDSTAALDIGAVEAGPLLLVNTAADENDGVGTGGVSLRDAIAAATDPGQRIGFDPTVF